MRSKAIPPHHVAGFPQLLRDASSFLNEHRRQGRLCRREPFAAPAVVRDPRR
jgi:hypothetical protein